MFDVEIVDAKGRPLRARVEIGNSQIILHSRSGASAKARNPDYRKALETIFSRFAEQYVTPETFLDSGPARKKNTSIEGRRLVSPDEIFVDAEEFATAVINRSNAGSSSHGAWRRLLMRVPPLPDYALRSIVDGTVERREGSSMRADQLRRVEKRHVDAAIAELRSGNARRTRFGNSTDWDLYTDDGEGPLPPKMVFGIALAEALKTHTTPDDFASGNQIFEMLRELGFRVEGHSNASGRAKGPRTKTGGTTVALVPTDEERGWMEGNPRVAEHLVRERSGTLPAQFKAAFRIDHGKLFCQQCAGDFLDLYEEAAIAEACFEVHHTIPVSQMPEGHVTTFDQLRLLCANCHRATHRKMASAAKQT
ncbi:HNH endonuclease [Caulobacter segnis]